MKVKNLQQFKFFRTENSAIDNPSITGNKLLIYLVLKRYADNGTQECYPSLKKIMENSGLTKKTIIKYLKELEKDNIIKIEKHKNKNGYDNNVYTLFGVPSVTDTPSDKDQVESLHLGSGIITPGVVESLHPKKTNNKKTNNKKTKTYVEQKDTPPYEEIISYLNEKADRSFKYTTKSTQRLINGRFNDGFDLEDFKAVIDVKCQEWKNNKKWSKYLRPNTLFNATKFEGYLQEAKNGKYKRDNEKSEEEKRDFNKEFAI